MALQKQTIGIELLGLAENVDDKKTTLGSLAIVDNVEIDKQGSFSKRDGYTVLSQSADDSSDTIASGVFCYSNGDAIHLLDSHKAWAYREGETTGWTDTGYITPVKTQEEVVYADNIAKYIIDYAYNSTTGVEAYAIQEETDALLIITVDADTNQILNKYSYAITTRSSSKLIASGNDICLVLHDGTDIHIGRYDEYGDEELDPEGAAVATDLHATNSWMDAILHTNGNIYIVYCNDNDDTTLLSWVPTASSVTDIGDLTADSRNGLCIIQYHNTDHVSFGDNIWLGYVDNSNDYYIGSWTLAGSSVVSAVNTGRIVSPDPCRLSPVWITHSASGDMWLYVFFQLYETNTEDVDVRFFALKENGASSWQSTYAYSAQLVSVPFSRTETFGEVGYILIKRSSEFQSTYYLCKVSGDIVNTDRVTPFPISSVFIGTAPEYDSDVFVASRAGKVNDNTFHFAIGQKSLAQTSLYTGTDAYSIHRYKVELNNPRVNTATLGDITYVAAGGPLQVAQRDHYGIAGFLDYPEFITATPSTSGGSMADGTYSYMLIWVWRDEKGNIYRSAPSVATQSVISGGGGGGKTTISVYVPTIHPYSSTAIHAQGNDIRCQLYRTEAEGTIYYFVAEFAALSRPTSSVVDTAADATITSNPQIYTTGASNEEVINIAPPSCSMLAVYKNRLFMAGCADREKVYYSKPRVSGEGLGFYTDFVITCEHPVTGIAVLTDKLIVFTESAIYYLFGDGPDKTGADNNFSELTLMTDDVGCSNTESIVSFDGGIVFESLKGMYLLSRDEEVQELVAAEDQVSDNTILSADVVPTKDQIRWLLDNGDLLVWDYKYNQWMTHDPDVAPVSTFAHDNKYNYLTSAGAVYQERNGGTYADNTTAIGATLQTEWINLGRLNQELMLYDIYIIGDYKSAHTLNVKVAYDYVSTWVDEKTWSTATGLTGGDTLWQIRVQPSQLRCQAFKLQISDSSQAGTNESFSISGLTLVIGLKKGVHLKAAKTI